MSIDPFRNGGKKTIAQWMRVLTGQEDGEAKDAVHALGGCGLRVCRDTLTLQVANMHAGLKVLYAGTRWADGVWVQALRRLRGADRSSGPMWFAGAASRATLVPLDAVPTEPGKQAEIGGQS
jgi:hypothetical protein